MEKTKRIGTRLAVFGCALALVTMAGVGMTFAKYTKSTSMDEDARVAAFGVTLSSSTDKIFKTDYTTAPSSINVTAKAPLTTDGIVAPGTTGTKTFTFTIADNEVGVDYNFNMTGTTGTGWKVSGTGFTDVSYQPIVWTLQRDVTTTSTVTTYWNGTTFATATTAPSLTYTQLAAATDSETFATQSNKSVTYTITWTWAFEQNAYLVTTAINQGAVTKSAGDSVTAAEYATLTAENQAKCEADSDAYKVKTGETINQAAINIAAGKILANTSTVPVGLINTNLISTDNADTILGDAASATLTVKASMTAVQTGPNN